MRCRVCKESELEVQHEHHHYNESGLSNVTLLNIEVFSCKNCGARVVSIPRMEELHRTLAFIVASQKPRLHATEVRFLRKYLGLSSKDLAEALGMAQETVSRWENGHEPMGPVAERLLRLMVIVKAPIEEYPIERLAEVAQDQAPKERIVLVDDKGWHLKQAA